MVIGLAQPLKATSIDEEKKKQQDMENNLDDIQNTLDKLETMKNDMYEYRNTSEVPILNLMLKVGLLFVLIYLILMLRAIYLAIWKSQNWYLKSCGIILAGDFLLQFIGNKQGPYLYSITIYTIIGISLS